MKILILGHKEHGKTTLANLLARYGFDFKDTSDLNVERFCEEQVPANTVVVENNRVVATDSATQKARKELAAKIKADKDDYRVALFNSLREFTKDEPTKFVDFVLQKSDIYCGMRSLEELKASVHKFDYIFVIKDKNKPNEAKESFDAAEYVFSDEFLSLPNVIGISATATEHALQVKVDAAVCCRMLDITKAELFQLKLEALRQDLSLSDVLRWYRKL